jgi:hypothetical protein
MPVRCLTGIITWCSMTTEEESARKLTEFLTERPTYGDRINPIEVRVRLGISKLTSEIADEIIKENPYLKTAIKSRVIKVIEKALHDDAYLNGLVTKAIAEALTRHALGSEDE